MSNATNAVSTRKATVAASMNATARNIRYEESVMEPQQQETETIWQVCVSASDVVTSIALAETLATRYGCAVQPQPRGRSGAKRRPNRHRTTTGSFHPAAVLSFNGNELQGSRRLGPCPPV